jgi:alkanesulfonate monooxygenase SsuD/methylene tetrahydromethanopterin reductase-like flavin-dependent oxidoreductase (luciferase family)
VPSSPDDHAGLHRGQTDRILLSTATTLITTNDPVKIAEDYAMLQHLADGRVDLMLGRGNTGPVYPWFGKDIRDGIALAVENYALLRRLWRRGRRRLGGQVPYAAAGLHLHPAPARRRPAVRVARLDPQPRDRRAGRVLRRRLLLQPHLLAEASHTSRWSSCTGALRALRPRHADQAIVGLGGQVYMRKNSQDAVREFRPYFDNAPVYGHGPIAGGLHRADAADRRGRRSR